MTKFAEMSNAQDGIRIDVSDIFAVRAPQGWRKRKARTHHRCEGYVLATGCGRAIAAGETYWQSVKRCGLDHAELCAECAKFNL